MASRSQRLGAWLEPLLFQIRTASLRRRPAPEIHTFFPSARRWDRTHNVAVVEELKSAALGFIEHPDGAWTWSFAQEDLTNDVGLLRGGAVDISRILGMPFVRLRLSLPEDLFPGVVAEAVGRRSGLDPDGLVAAFRAEQELKVDITRRTSVHRRQQQRRKRLWGEAHVRAAAARASVALRGAMARSASRLSLTGGKGGVVAHIARLSGYSAPSRINAQSAASGGGVSWEHDSQRVNGDQREGQTSLRRSELIMRCASQQAVMESAVGSAAAPLLMRRGASGSEAASVTVHPLRLTPLRTVQGSPRPTPHRRSAVGSGCLPSPPPCRIAARRLLLGSATADAEAVVDLAGPPGDTLQDVPGLSTLPSRALPRPLWTLRQHCRLPRRNTVSPGPVAEGTEGAPQLLSSGARRQAGGSPATGVGHTSTAWAVGPGKRTAQTPPPPLPPFLAAAASEDNAVRAFEFDDGPGGSSGGGSHAAARGVGTASSTDRGGRPRAGARVMAWGESGSAGSDSRTLAVHEERAEPPKLTASVTSPLSPPVLPRGSSRRRAAQAEQLTESGYSGWVPERLSDSSDDSDDGGRAKDLPTSSRALSASPSPAAAAASGRDGALTAASGGGGEEPSSTPPGRLLSAAVRAGLSQAASAYSHPFPSSPSPERAVDRGGGDYESLLSFLAGPAPSTLSMSRSGSLGAPPTRQSLTATIDPTSSSGAVSRGKVSRESAMKSMWRSGEGSQQSPGGTAGGKRLESPPSAVLAPSSSLEQRRGMRRASAPNFVKPGALSSFSPDSLHSPEEDPASPVTGPVRLRSLEDTGGTLSPRSSDVRRSRRRRSVAGGEDFSSGGDRPRVSVVSKRRKEHQRRLSIASASSSKGGVGADDGGSDDGADDRGGDGSESGAFHLTSPRTPRTPRISVASSEGAGAPSGGRPSFLSSTPRRRLSTGFYFRCGGISQRAL